MQTCSGGAHTSKRVIPIFMSTVDGKKGDLLLSPSRSQKIQSPDDHVLEGEGKG